jgi:hypothetical protein
VPTLWRTMERPNPDDEPPPDSGPGDGERKPRDPKPQNPKVTPLDEDKHIEDGIEIKET